MPVDFDSRSWPIVVARIHGRDRDEDIVALLDGLRIQLSRGRCAVILDTTEVVYPSISDAQRWSRQEGEWLKRHRTLVQRNCSAVSFVITNPTIRFVLSGVLLIGALPCKYAVVATAPEARAFCATHLKEVSRAAPRASMRVKVRGARPEEDADTRRRGRGPTPPKAAS